MLSRRKLPALNALRAFEVSGRRLSFRSAAEELGVTQGAVAQQVRALEEHLGVTLFQRLPRGLALTLQGSVYLADLTHAFDILGDATDVLVACPNIVTISVTPTFAAKLLIPRLGDLSACLPEIELRTVATETLSDFERDQVDLAVRLTGSDFSHELDAIRLFSQELLVVASPELVKGMRLPLTIESLKKMPLLHDAHNHWPKVLNCTEPLAGAKFNQTTLAIDVALAGQGVALACRAFVTKDIEFGRLIQIHDSYFVEPDYYLVRKRALHINPAVEAVWQWCLKEFSLS